MASGLPIWPRMYAASCLNSAEESVKARARVEIASEVPMLLSVKRARNLASRECSPLQLSTEALRVGMAAVIWASVRRGVLGSSMASTEMVIL